MRIVPIIVCLLAGFTLSLWTATVCYQAGVTAGTERGKAQVYERIMAGAVYNLGALK